MFTRIAALVSVLGLMLMLMTVSTRATPLLQTDATQQKQTLDAVVQQRLAQTALANPLTATAAFELTINAAVNQALTATAIANNQPIPASGQNVSYTAQADSARYSRLSRSLTSPGWRAETIPANSSAPIHSRIAYWTKPSAGIDWFQWTFSPTTTGVYQVAAYIPSLFNAPRRISQSVRYQISYAGGGTSVMVDQASNIGQEVVLGQFELYSGNQYSVFIDDNTGETGSVAIAADTITWQFISGQTSNVVPPQPAVPPVKSNYGAGTAVIVLDAGRVWSAPNVKTARVLRTLDPGTEVYIVSGPVYGPIRYDSDIEGYWYQVTYSFDQSPLGWMWSERVRLAGE